MITIDNDDGTFTHTLEPGDANVALFAMRYARTTWPPADFDGDEQTSFALCYGSPEAQPGFGVEIGWNRPHARWWQPYIAITLWRRGFQVGWLYD